MGWLNRDGVNGVGRVGMMGWREEERMSNIQQAESHIHHESRNIYATIPFLSLRLKLNASHL